MDVCIYDHLEQCDHGCSRCVRRESLPECEFCGNEENIYNTDDGYVCEECLKQLVIDGDGVIKNMDVITGFLSEQSKEFCKYLKEWFADCKVVNYCE